jgi:quinol monooxygenase YgiN
MPVCVFASFYPKPDKLAEAEAILLNMVEHTRTEPGCRVYNLHRLPGDEPSLHIYEIYDDQAAVEHHRSMEYYKNYRATIPDLLGRPVEVKFLDAVDVKTT